MNRSVKYIGCVAKWIGIALLSLLILVVVGLLGATWWYTPERLGELISREASERTNADVRVSDVRYTLWSSFPHLFVEADSISVNSRNFDSIPTELKKQLPENASFLVSTGKLRGGINLLDMMRGKYMLRDVQVDSLYLNLVALTDSINNYDIVPSTGKSGIPYFHVDTLRISKGGLVEYSGIPSQTYASIKLKGASLLPVKKDSYKLNFMGDVSARSGGLTVLRGFPIQLGGDVSLRFKPFGVSTDNYAVRLGTVNGKMSMDMNFGENMSIDNFQYRLDSFTLQNLLDLLPDTSYPFLSHLDADINLSADARLTSPYDFASTRLPSLEVDFAVADGDITYSLSDNESYSARHIGLRGLFVFDGENPSASRFIIPDFRVEGEGVSLDIAGEVSDLTADPKVEATLRGKADLARMRSEVKSLAQYAMSGTLNLDAKLGFRLADKTLYGSSLDVAVESPQLTLGSGPMQIRLADFKASTSEKYPEALTLAGLLNDIPLEVKATAGGAHFIDKKDSLELHMASLKMDGNIGRLGHKDVMRKFGVNFRGDNVALNTPQGEVKLQGVDALLSASRMSRPMTSESFKVPEVWNSDSATMAFAAHTPQYIKVALPQKFKNLMKQWRTYASLKIKKGEIETPQFPLRNTLHDIDLQASFDSVTVRNFALRSGATAMRMAGSVTNLRQFLNSPVPAPLRVKLDVDIDTVQMNELARAWGKAHPKSINKEHIEASAQVPDTVALILPRNLIADIHATAKQTRYINLHLYDLSTDLHTRGGNLDLDSLKISADFGHAFLNWRYNTSDMQRLAMNLSVGVLDVDVVRFFQNFHKLLLMMPEMKNLSGTISAQADGRLLIFPDMYLNTPSVVADVNVEGRGLKVHQNKFIRHVTRMLLIPDAKDLHIADMNVHAAVHNNLLELFPFDFEVSRYKLRMGGLNNFDGDIYYHIGVENWPLKIPFGINIKGKYHHPQLRFGGSGWKDEHGAEIAGGIMDYTPINIMSELKKYMGEFVRTAATYQGE